MAGFDKQISSRSYAMTWSVARSCLTVKCSFLLVTALSIFQPAKALDITGELPGAVHRGTIESQEFFNRQQQLERQRQHSESDELIEIEPVPEPDQAESDQRIFVHSFDVSESQILTPNEITSVLKNYEGRHLSMYEIQQMLDALNTLYVEKNAVAARAILPPQKVKNNIIQVRLVEARLAEIIVQNNHSTHESYVIRGIRVIPGELADIPLLERELRYFNRVNDIKISALLAAGEKPEPPIT